MTNVRMNLHQQAKIWMEMGASIQIKMVTESLMQMTTVSSFQIQTRLIWMMMLKEMHVMETLMVIMSQTYQFITQVRTIVLLLLQGNLTLEEEQETEVHVVTVDSTNLRFTPSTLTINEGDTLRFVWGGQALPHNSVEENGVFDSGDPERAVDYGHVFDYDSAGTYSFFCEPHEAVGMTGSVTVLDVEAPADEEELRQPNRNINGRERSINTRCSTWSCPRIVRSACSCHVACTNLRLIQDCINRFQFRCFGDGHVTRHVSPWVFSTNEFSERCPTFDQVSNRMFGNKDAW